MRTEVVRGSNLQSAIAIIAQRYAHFSASGEATEGVCHCNGGQSHCVGCDAHPIYHKLSRVRGLNGQEGPPGRPASIIVRSNRGGGSRRYTSRYDLRLVDFDVEDENEDGIFEPGEHIYIRRIRIRNTGKQLSYDFVFHSLHVSGGMPSPTCRIPVSVVDSSEIELLNGEQSMAYIPSSIRPGGVVTLQGFVKVKLRIPESHIQLGVAYSIKHTLSLKAQMPSLNRVLPNFDFTKEIEIQYPLEMLNFNLMPSLARGSVNKFTWEASFKIRKIRSS